MNEPNATPPAIKGEKGASAAERMSLLHALMFTALRLIDEQIDGFSARLVGALASQAEQSTAAVADACRHAWQHLNPHRPTFHRLLGDSLQQALLKAVQAAGGRARPAQAATTDAPGAGFAAMERKLLIEHLSQVLDATDPDALGALDLRIAHWLQSDGTGIERNPFRSEVFLSAVDDAWRKFDSNSESGHQVLRQMRPGVFLELAPVWQALNRDMAARGVLPDAQELYRRRHAEAGHAHPPSLRERVRRRLAPHGELSLARMEELFDKAFEQLADDEVIPADIRALLVRLKEPLRTIALQDIAFFFNDRHPARRLLASFIDCGLGYLPQGHDRDDPLYRALEAAVDQVRQAGGAPDALFDRIIGELESAAALQAQAAQGALHKSIEEATAQEREAQMQQLAEEDVAARVETGEVAGFVESFLQAQWTRVLAFAYGVRDTRPEVLPGVQKAMDELVWSVKPQPAPQERKEMVARLPALLAALNAWLNVIKWEGEERDAFFAALAERHAATTRGPADLTPRDQLEIRMTAMQKASEHQLSRRAREQQEEALAPVMQQVGRLAPGRWVEFVRNNGSKVNCRLAWVSPARSRLVFVGRRGELVFAIEDKALAQALRASRASIIAIDPIAAALDRLDAG